MRLAVATRSGPSTLAQLPLRRGNYGAREPPAEGSAVRDDGEADADADAVGAWDGSLVGTLARLGSPELSGDLGCVLGTGAVVADGVGDAAGVGEAAGGPLLAGGGA